jgi:hypothetical protein
MRTVTANAQAYLDQDMGTEYVVILEVEWVEDGSIFYSGQDVEGCQAKILQMGDLDTSMILEGSSDSQDLSVVLDDTDGSIRAIYNANDIHKRPARVYILPKGLELNDKILIFKGELVTPIEWDETQRSASFNILSKLNSNQVGFSMEEGDFPNIPDEALGKAWPLVFGQVCHLPAVKVRAPRRGYLLEGTGIHDFTLDPRICQALKLSCPSQSAGTQSVYEQGPNNVWSIATGKTIVPDIQCVNRRFAEICRLRDLYDQQVAYESDTLNIYNGVSFPQDEKVTIFANNALFQGTFSGNTFTIIVRYHPDFFTFAHQTCRDVPELGYGTRTTNAMFGNGSFNFVRGYAWALSGLFRTVADSAFQTWKPSKKDTYFTANQSQEEAFASCDAALTTGPGMIGGPVDAWSFYDAMQEASFFWAPAGTEVYMQDEAEILYIVSLLPGTVDGVAAYRTAPNGFRYLTEVPSDFYTVYETDYQGYQVVEIGLNKSLALYDDSWSEELYVSFTSSIGPNPCDIIEWLVGKYTNLTVDAASFASVKSALTNYPKNFYLTTRPDVYKLIQDIAYQSRCSVYVRNDVVYIKYLSVEPSSERTINENDILSGSFVESLSETEDVYTTHAVTWKKAGASVQSGQELDRKIILKYNVDKYGTVEEAWNYYTDNIYELILKTSTFWLIRKANSWKKVRFKLPIKHMDLDVGDCITLDVAQFSPDQIKIVIEQITLNTEENTLDVICWTPIRSGETAPYYWAWPSAQAEVAIWPLDGDPNGGAGYSFEVTPPVGHLLLGGSHRDDQLVITTGDRNPSDVGDVLPSLTCELSDYIDFDEEDPVIIAKQIAQSAARQAMEGNIGGGGNSGGSSENKDEGGGSCGSGSGCNYKVDVQWHTSEAQGSARGAGLESAPGGPCGGPCGCLDKGGCPSCYGPIWTVCHSFGTLWAARSFADYMEASYGYPKDHYWQCNQTAVLNTFVSDGSHSGAGAEDCEKAGTESETGDPGDGTVGGETQDPVGSTGREPT